MPDPVCTDVSRVVTLNRLLPAFVYHELYDYCRDAEHALTLDLDQIRPDTQALIAGILKDHLDDPFTTMQLDRRAQFYNPHIDMGTGLPIPLPLGVLKLPGSATLTIWSKDFADTSKYTGATLKYTLFRF
jgi:hypothetical protein